MKNKKYWLLILFFLVISFFTRATQVFNPYNYYFDSEKATEYLVTKSIVVDHKIVLTAHQGGLNTFSKPPGFNYLLAIPFILANGDPFGGRVFMFIISVLTVITAFVLANRMLGIKTAFFVGFFMAVSPLLKDYSSSVSPPFIIPFFMVIFLYILYEIFKGKRNLILILMFVVGLMANFEMAVSITLLLLLTLTGIVYLYKKAISVSLFLISLAFYIINLLPLLIFDLQNNFYNTKGLYKVFVEIGNHASKTTLSNLADLIIDRLSVFGWNFSATFTTGIIIWLPLLMIIVFGVISILKDKKIKPSEIQFISYLAIIPFFTFGFLLFYPEIVIPQWWIIDLSVVYCFLLGTILNYFWKINNIKFIVVIIIFILGILSFKRTVFLYKTQFVFPPINYIKEDAVLNFIFKDAKGKPFGILISSMNPQKNYDYLIWWNGETKYHYQPYKEKGGLYYLLIEPNIKISLDSKKYINLRSGKLIKTTKLDNGFVIEKRFEEI